MAKKELDKEIEELTTAIKEPEVKDNPNEKVILEIPISSDNEDDWVCIINGHSYQIRRGEKVLVPKFVKELYDNEQRQLKIARENSRKLQEAAQDKGKQLAFY